MMALALAEDSITKRERRDAIIDELGQLPGEAAVPWGASKGRGEARVVRVGCCRRE
jgi:hypothetical protein